MAATTDELIAMTIEQLKDYIEAVTADMTRAESVLRIKELDSIDGV